MTSTTTLPDTVLCPHCGAELKDDDELCRFCGKVMMATVAQKGGCARGLMTELRALKAHIRPMTGEEIDAQKKSLVIFDHTNPANPIWNE